MAIEADEYYLPMHAPCGAWEWVETTKIEPNETEDSGKFHYFFPAEIDIREGDGFAVIFGENAKRVHARYKGEGREYISGNIEFPIVMFEGDVVELFSSNKSVDLALEPARIPREE